MLTISSISKHHFVVLSLVVLDRFDQIVHRSRPEPLSILQSEKWTLPVTTSCADLTIPITAFSADILKDGQIFTILKYIYINVCKAITCMSWDCIEDLATNYMSFLNGKILKLYTYLCYSCSYKLLLWSIYLNIRYMLVIFFCIWLHGVQNWSKTFEIKGGLNHHLHVQSSQKRKINFLSELTINTYILWLL